MIIQELKAEFNEYFHRADAELILWLDPERQWRWVENDKEQRRVEFMRVRRSCYEKKYNNN